jgi:hypothetical protein
MYERKVPSLRKKGRISMLGLRHGLQQGGKLNIFPPMNKKIPSEKIRRYTKH